MSAEALSLPEMVRYQRQMILPEVGREGQEKLKQAHVLVVGAGGLGCPALTYLVAAGVGTIRIADGDRVDRTNLHRQPLYSEASVGMRKVEEAVRVLRGINPEVHLDAWACRVDAANVREVLSGIEIVVDGSDNFSTKYLLNDACVEMDKVLVSGSVFRFEGQVSVFNADLGGGVRGPTYRCLFPDPPSADLVPSCAEAGVLGVLPGVVGTLQSAEVLKLVLGIGRTLSGRLLLFDSLSMAFSEVSFRRQDALAASTKIQPDSYYLQLTSDCTIEVSQISPAELRRRMARNEDMELIDVREPFEKEEYDIGGQLIPGSLLRINAYRIPRDKTVVLYCRSGARSRKGIAELRREFGFTNLVNLEGGLMAWQVEAREN